MVGGWVGLARDGCLVRSLVGVTQWGWRSSGASAQRGGCELLQKQPTTTALAMVKLVSFEVTNMV